MPYTSDFTNRLRRRRPFDPLDPLAEDDELLQDEEFLPGTAELPLPVRPASAPAPIGPSLPEPPALPPVPPRPRPIAPAAPTPPAPPAPPAPPPKSALETAVETVRGMPQRPRPGLLRGALATGAAALGGFYHKQIPAERTQQAAENILYPGYGRKMEDWGQQVKATGTLAELETKQAQERRLEAQHGASMKSEEAQLASEGARQEYYKSRQNMPPKPERFTTYEAYLVSKIQNGSPEEQQAAQVKLNELKAKNSPEKNLIVKEFHDEPTGDITLRFYDPVTGELKKEEKHQAVARRRPPSPLTVNTLGYREKQTKARDLAGQALRLFPNDKAKAREWLAQQTSDDEVFEMALERIGAPSAAKEDKSERARRILGLPAGASTSGGSPATGNPYRK